MHSSMDTLGSHCRLEYIGYVSICTAEPGSSEVVAGRWARAVAPEPQANYIDSEMCPKWEPDYGDRGSAGTDGGVY